MPVKGTKISNQHGLAPRHCWAIPPNRCSASRDAGDYWDSEKDLQEVFSICCPASQVVPEAAEISKKTIWKCSQFVASASLIVSKDFPSHQILQQGAPSNSCLAKYNSAASARNIYRLHTMLLMPSIDSLTSSVEVPSPANMPTGSELKLWFLRSRYCRFWRSAKGP